MKKSLITALFLILTASTLNAQATESPASTDSTKVMLQALLSPSFNPHPILNYSRINFHFSGYGENKIQHYLNLFNSVITQVLLTVPKDGFTLDDFPNRQPVFYHHNTAFQYNYIQSLRKFSYFTNVQKANW